MDKHNIFKFIGILCLGFATGYTVSSLINDRNRIKTLKIEKENAKKKEEKQQHAQVPPASPSSGATHQPWDLVYRDYKLVDTLVQEDMRIDQVMVMKIPHLSDYLDEDVNADFINVKYIQSKDLKTPVYYRNYLTDDTLIMADIVRKPNQTKSRAFIRGGPREKLWFDPTKTNVAIVTTGGLCPGLNNIIRHLTLSLQYGYGTPHVFGILNGFWGFDQDTYIELNNNVVRDIQFDGGSILGSNRGGLDAEKIIGWLQKHDVQVLFIIGGDGSHRAAGCVYEKIKERKLNICIAGVPKTIDNDVDLVDRSFGFNTAVDESVRVIQSAYIEAKCVKNGIGLVKLMGRSAGSIAAHATMASGVVDLCLIPEVPVILNGQLGFLPWIEKVLARKHYCVIVVAEGVSEKLSSTDLGVDKGGNKIIEDVGPMIKGIIKQYFAPKNMEINIKYIDPSYIIRSVKANSDDSVLCMTLSQSGVHAALAGYTGFTVGLTNNRSVLLPIDAVVANSPRPVNPFGRTWERILISTGQPDTTGTLESKFTNKLVTGVQFTT